MQTNFNDRLVSRMLGLDGRSQLNENISLIGAVQIPFGIVVKRGTVEGTCDKIAVNGTSEVGVGVTRLNHVDQTNGVTGEYVAGRTVSIKQRGEIAVAVLTADTVIAGDSAYMIVDATNYGKWTKTAGSNTVSVGAKFQTSKDATGLAYIKLDVIA